MATLKIVNIDNDTGIGGDGITADNRLVIHGTAAASGSVDIYLDGNKIGTALTDGANGLGWKFDYQSVAIPDGAHVLSAVSGGLTSSVFNITIDTQALAPTLTLANDTGASATDHITSDASLRSRKIIT
jgi:large repetitive protein